MNRPTPSRLVSRRPFKSFWSADRSLSVMLGLIALVVFVIIPIFGLDGIQGILVEIIFSLALVSGLVRVVHRKHAVVLAIGLVAAAIIVRWLRLVGIVSGAEALSSLLTSAALGLMAVLLLVDVLRPGPINLDRILGAVAAYLLLALVWAQGYFLLESRSPGALHLPVPGSTPVPLYWSTIYFSLATITTAGYGDITPVDPIAQSMAMLEAMLGQLYPAILIGRLVGNWSANLASE